MNSTSEDKPSTRGSTVVLLIVAWLWAGVPLIWGLTQTIEKAAALFQ